MRKNCQAVYRAWRQQEAHHGSAAVWTDGETVYSYQTAIATRDELGDPIINRTSYSTTTSEHQNAIADARPDAAMVDGLPVGAKRDALIRAAKGDR